MAVLQVSRRLRIDVVLGSIASGKEAKIYPARTLKGEYIALKIYYTSTASHKRAVVKYTTSDARFKNLKSKGTKELIYTWARKEFSNLKRMYENGVRVPKPLLLHKNVLAMEFLGEDGIRAPLLVELEDEEVTEELYREILNQVELSVKRSGLVHGDLSEYNVMIVNRLPYLIDVGQAILVEDETARDLLRRDIENVNRFFSSKGVDVLAVEEILARLGFE